MRAGNERVRAQSEELPHHFRRLGGAATVIIGQKRTCHTLPTGLRIKSLVHVWFMLKQSLTLPNTLRNSFTSENKSQKKEGSKRKQPFRFSESSSLTSVLTGIRTFCPSVYSSTANSQSVVAKAQEKRKDKKDTFTDHWHDYMLGLVPPTVLDISSSFICCGLSAAEPFWFAVTLCLYRNNTIWVKIN